MNGPGDLGTFEAIVDDSLVAGRLEVLLAIGVRPRQLSVRTLLIGTLLALADGRAAHLTRVYRTLLGLSEADRRRLGVVVEWKGGPHPLTYRQVERTFSLVVAALAKETPDGAPGELLGGVVNDLLEASIPAAPKQATTALAVDWTDVESFARPPVPARTAGSKDEAVPGDADPGRASADPEASWGHRRGDSPGQHDELFFGYYLGLATMVNEEGGGAVPELVRRMLLTGCATDPVPAFARVVEKMAATGVSIGDVLCDSGYSHRVPLHWALLLRALGANLVMDLHPHDRGRQGTFEGAICFNGGLYCPSTPEALFAIEPLARGASAEQVSAHDRRSAELARYKLGAISADDGDGYHRVMCPAAMGKVRCPRREPSMALSAGRPEILAPPEHPPTCCRQQTLTVPPTVNAKTRQKHDYPSRAHRLSYGRRSAAERANSTIKDPASNDISRGWCRLTSLAPMALMLGCLLVVRNQRVLASFAFRAAENERRMANGLAPRTRQRRRQSIGDLVAAAPTPP